MMNENSFIYRFLCISWVLITAVSRNTARVNAAQIFAVGVRVALPFLLLLVLLLHYGEGKRCPNFRR